MESSGQAGDDNSDTVASSDGQKARSQYFCHLQARLEYKSNGWAVTAGRAGANGGP